MTLPFEPCPKKPVLLRPELPLYRLPLGVDGAGLPPLERLRPLTLRVRELAEPLLNDEDECADVSSGRSPLLDPPGTGGAGREGVREEPFHEAMVGLRRRNGGPEGA